MKSIKTIKLIDNDEYTNKGKPIYEIFIFFDDGTFDRTKYIPTLKAFHKGNRAMKKEIRELLSDKEV